MGQRFVARERREYRNGAIGWAPGGPFDCLGYFAKVQNCPVHVVSDARGNDTDTGTRRTCYATGYPESFFSVPACTKIKGRNVPGFFTFADGSPIFVATVPLEAQRANWQRATDPHLHGYRASNGNRSALVVRVEACAWEWFAERDGRIVVTGEHGPRYRNVESAKRQAEGYLTTGHVFGRDFDALPLATVRFT